MPVPSKRKIFLLDLTAEKMSPSADAQELLIMPRGNYYVEKYDKTLTFDDVMFQAVIDNFNNPALSKPYIDCQHNFGESFSDITALTIKPEGLTGMLNLNEKGITAIKDRRYKYISPVVDTVIDNAGVEHNNVLVTASLTNVPALLGSMPTVQSQIQLSKDNTNTDIIILKKTEKQEEKRMIALAKYLGLVESSNEETILSSVRSISLERDTLKGKVIELEKAKGDAEKTATELGQRVQAIELERNKATAEGIVLEAIKDGQYHPALKDMKIAQYLKDPESIKVELSLLPKIASGQRSSGEAGKTENGLDETDKKIMLDRGMSPDKAEDVAKYKAAVGIK